MKKALYSIFIFLFLISNCMVSASALTIDTSRGVLTDQEKTIIQAYQNGHAYEEEYIQIRKEKAQSSGLMDYCDEMYFLTQAFYNTYPSSMLMQDGLQILDRYTFESGGVAMPIMLFSNGHSVTGYTQHRFEDENGNWINNGLWSLSNGYQAFCAEGLMASPQAGDTTSAPEVLTNENLRKALYYGYGGPEDLLTSRYGASAAIVLTDELVSYAYSGTCISIVNHNGYHWNKTVSGLWNSIVSKSVPASYEAYMVRVHGQGSNWQGVIKNKQVLVYGDYKPKGSLQIQKKSALEDICLNNPHYSLYGAQYGVYSDDACSQLISTLTIGEDGYSNVLSDLDCTTYYVKETLAPSGYALDETVYPVKVNSDVVNVCVTQDIPSTNIIDLLIVKTGEEDINATLADAQFICNFYVSDIDDTPDRSWILKSDADGNVYLKDEYKVSGDAFYYDLDGNVVLPMGTITIQEIMAPQGYMLNDELFTQVLESDCHDMHFDLYQTTEVVDRLVQLKLKKVQSGTEIGLSGVVFELVDEHGHVRELTTSQSGDLVLSGLWRGHHILTEKASASGYVLNTEPIEFDVLEDGTIVMNDEIVDSFVLENDVEKYALEINKVNGKHELLDGAVFGLYEDKECTKQLDEQTSKSGSLRFEGLNNLQKYYVKEIKAPEGYIMNDHVYEVYVDFVPMLDQYDVYIDETLVDEAYQDGVVSMDIINQKIIKIPPTGVATYSLWIGSAFISLLVLLRIIKK